MIGVEKEHLLFSPGNPGRTEKEEEQKARSCQRGRRQRNLSIHRSFTSPGMDNLVSVYV
jgi:hypothetical protein